MQWLLKRVPKLPEQHNLLTYDEAMYRNLSTSTRLLLRAQSLYVRSSSINSSVSLGYWQNVKQIQELLEKGVFRNKWLRDRFQPWHHLAIVPISISCSAYHIDFVWRVFTTLFVQMWVWAKRISQIDFTVVV